MGGTGAAVVIPARLESTRLPRKLLLAETGRPLLAHTVERVLRAKAESSGAITRVLVAADDEALVRAAREAGAEAVLTRADHRSGTDRIAEAARALPEDVIVNVQGDEPEIEPAHVLAAATLLDGRDEPMGTLAYPLRAEDDFRNPNLVKVVIDREGRALYFSRAPIPFPRTLVRPGRSPTCRPREGMAAAAGWLGEGGWGLGHMGIYVYRKELLLRYTELPRSSLEERERLEQLRALEAGVPIRVAVVTPPRGRPVDTPEDYEQFRIRVEAEGKIA